MGYDWFFRIADDAKLSEAVTHDIFDRLNQQGKRYGLLNVMLDNNDCLGNLWPTVSSHCLEDGVSCSPLFKDWPVGVVVMTNFEVSHFSLWESPIFQRVSLAAEQSLHTGHREAYWSDAAIHTVSMITHLRENEVAYLNDIKYVAKMNMKGIVHGAPSLSMDGNFSRVADEDSLVVVASPRLPKLNKLFKSQRFGWLGGDVASSCALPSPADTSTTANNGVMSIINGVLSKGKESSNTVRSIPRRYIWLFGDSLIGTSTPTR